MAWTLASKVIRVDDQQYGGRIDANFAIQDPLDAVASVISYFGARSQVTPLQFQLWEEDNSSTGLSTLIAAAKAGTTVALVGDTGALGSFKMLSFEWRRVQALNKSTPCYACSAELIIV